MKRFGLAAIVIVLSLGMTGGCPRQDEMNYLDNGVIKVGVNLDKGGSITYVAEYNNQEVNLINSADLGREIQQSYYSGPQPYGNPHPGWANWPWNPIGAGDCYGNPSEVLEVVNDGQTLFSTKIRG